MGYPCHHDRMSGNRRHLATMHLFRDVLEPTIFNDNPKAILDFCFAERLLVRNRVYSTCFLNMKLMPRRQLTDKLACTAETTSVDLDPTIMPRRQLTDTFMRGTVVRIL